MKYCATLILASEGGESTPMAISPSDNVWFVPAGKATPEIEELAREVEEKHGMAVLGHICVSDDYKPED